MKIGIALEGQNGSVDLEYDFKMPNVGHLNRMAKQIQQNPLGAQKALLMSCIEEGYADRFNEDCEKYPGLVAAIATRLLDLTGFTAEVTVKN